MRISNIIDNPEAILDLIGKYEGLIADAERNILIKGKTLEFVNREQPELYLEYGRAHAECDNVVKYMEARTDRARSETFKKIKSTSDRALADRTIEKFVDAEQEIMDLFCLYLELRNCRDKLAAVVEALKSRGYALKNIIEARVHGLHFTTV